MKKIAVIFLFFMVGILFYVGIKARYEVKNINEIAYGWLDSDYKNLVKNKEALEIKVIPSCDEHVIVNNGEMVNIENMSIYKVIFDTENQELLGPVVVYLEKDTLKVLGMDFRE